MWRPYTQVSFLPSVPDELLDLEQLTFPPWPPIFFPEGEGEISVSYTVFLGSPESIPEVI